MNQIELYEKSNIDALDWPATEAGRQARALLLPMIREGVSAFIRNVETDLYVLKMDDLVIPLTVNAREYNNSYLTSNYFPIKYLEEKFSTQNSPLRHLKNAVIQGCGCLLKGVKINKAVVVNNWLLTTNIYASLSEEVLAAITQFLTTRFPDHILIFRSINTRKCESLRQGLAGQRYRLMFTRRVCVYDPQEKEHFSPKVHYHHRRDRRLIDAEGYEIVHYNTMQPAEGARLLELYGDLYLTRHTSYSPQYTEKFLKTALQHKFLHLVALKKEGKIYGVIGFHEREGTLIAPFCGYDQQQAQGGHLYRMLTILAIEEAETRKAVFNDGSGGEAPKQYRGMRTFPEYVALYDRHLPLYRRLFWGAAETLTKIISRSPQS